ncbi:MAG TPA: YkvA family protein [Hyphomicrobiales bacterium]|nr:YkvA family protein [Hyphomicrobiales bacterium]
MTDRPTYGELEENAAETLRGSTLPVVVARNEAKVKRDFWSKLKRYLTRIPFAEDLLAAYYCATDAATPVKAKGLLFAALAYFILPTDLIPDFLAGLGFSDDATVLMMAVAMIRSHMKPEHRAAARKALDDLERDAAA